MRSAPTDVWLEAAVVFKEGGVQSKVWKVSQGCAAAQLSVFGSRRSGGRPPLQADLMKPLISNTNRLVCVGVSTQTQAGCVFLHSGAGRLIQPAVYGGFQLKRWALMQLWGGGGRKQIGGY